MLPFSHPNHHPLITFHRQTGGVGTVRSRSGPGLQDAQLVLEEEARLFSEDSDESSDEADENEYFDALDGNEGKTGPRTPLLNTFTTPERTDDPAQHPPSAPQLSVQPSSPETPTQNRQREAFLEKPTTTPTIPTTPVAATAPKRNKMFPLPISLPRRVSGLASSTSISSPSFPAPSSPSLSASTPGAPVDPVTGEAMPGTPSAEKDKKKRLGGKFRRSWGGGSAPGMPGTPSSAIPTSDTQGSLGEAAEGTVRKPMIRGMRKKGPSGKSYSFHAGKDILGIVMLEIGRVEDLPKVKNCA